MIDKVIQFWNQYFYGLKLKNFRNVIFFWNTLYLKTWKHFRGKVVSKRPWIFGLHMKAKQKKEKKESSKRIFVQMLMNII